MCLLIDQKNPAIWQAYLFQPLFLVTDLKPLGFEKRPRDFYFTKYQFFSFLQFLYLTVQLFK
jgi:hypothetical protein